MPRKPAINGTKLVRPRPVRGESSPAASSANGSGGLPPLTFAQWARVGPVKMETDKDAVVQPFTRIRARFKSRFEHELGPNTVIVGRNQRGKTSIVEAFETPFEGRHASVTRADSAAGWVAELAPPGENLVSVELFDAAHGDRPVAFFWAEKGRPSRSAGPRLDALGPQAMSRVFPMRLFADLFSESGIASKRRLFTTFGGASIRALVDETSLSAAQRAAYDAAVAAADETFRKEKEPPLPVDRFAEISKKLNGQATALASQVRQYEERIAALNTSGEAAGAEQLPLLEARYAAAAAWEGQAEYRTEKAHLEARLATANAGLMFLAAGPYPGRDLDAELRAHASAVETASAAWEALKAEAATALAGVEGQLRQAQAVVAALTAGHVGCGHCAGHWKSQWGSLLAAAERYPRTDVEAALKAAQEAWETRVRDKALFEGEVQAQRIQHDAAVRAAERDAADARAGLARLAARYPVEAAKPPHDVPAATLATQIQSLQVLVAAAEELSRLTRERNALQREHLEVQQLADDAAQKIDRVNAAVKAEAEHLVNAHMGPDLRLVYDLDRPGWTVTGVDGRGHQHTACGWERRAAMPALALAYANREVCAPFMVLDEQHLVSPDPENMKKLFATFKGLQEAGQITQNIFVLPPTLVGHPDVAEIVEGWHVIYV